MTGVVWTASKVAGAVFIGINMAGLQGWLERKQSAITQDRIGANRASIFGFALWGMVNMIADPIKMLTKEDFVPRGSNRLYHQLAPMISMAFAALCLAALPFGGTVTVAGRVWDLQPLSCSVGLPLVLAFLSLGVHGVMMAGYASGSNYGLLGALRGAAQMVSYEVCLAASLAGAAFLYGTLDLAEAVRWQASHVWGLAAQPLAFVLFLTAGAAESKRGPFDVPEGESEIVGYHVEFSGMKFGMFLVTDFIETTVVAGLATTLFLGGWLVPGLDLPSMGALGGFLMVNAFCLKTAVLLVLLMQLRWTLPRFRFDQVLDLCWKNILPLSLANFLATVWGVALWR